MNGGDTRYRTHIDAMEFLAHLRGRLGPLLGAAIAGCLLAALVATGLARDTYAATARLYILGPGDEQLNLSDLEMGSLLTGDYVEALRTWEVREMVCQRLGLRMDADELGRSVRLNAIADAHIVEITVRADDAGLAAEIANGLAQAAQDFFRDRLGVVGAELFSAARPPAKPEGTGTIAYATLGFLLGGFAALAVVFVRYALDLSPRTPEDIRAAAGLSVLAEMPHAGSGTDEAEGA